MKQVELPDNPSARWQEAYRYDLDDLRADLADFVKVRNEKGAIECASRNGFEGRFDSGSDGVLIAEIIE